MSGLDPVFREVNRAHLARELPPGSPGHAGRLEFALGRLEEGRKTLGYLQARYGDALASDGGRWRVLDLGCGNGGLVLPFAEAGHRCWGLDLGLHPELATVLDRTGLPLRPLQGRGEALPFPDDSLDLVLLAETVEHVPDVRAVGREVARVLRPGGLCWLTTPPRLRFLLRGDPHYGVPGLALLPDPLQRFVFERWVAPGEAYDVVHLFWSVAGLLRQLPGLELVEITSKNWSGPLRRLDWDWIVVRKPLPARASGRGPLR